MIQGKIMCKRPKSLEKEKGGHSEVGEGPGFDSCRDTAP